MTKTPTGLGRGLSALLGGMGDMTGGPEVVVLPLSAVRANPKQPRRHFSDAALADLAGSIKEQGILQPVLVRPVRGEGPADYEIVAGERRWRAARLAGLTEIPALVKDVGDLESLALALIENLQREDLNPVEQAAGMRDLIDRFGLSQDDLAKRLGMSRPAVANTLRLLQLPDAMRDGLTAGLMTAGHARAILSLDDEAARETLWARIRDEKLSVRQTEDMAAIYKQTGRFPEAAASLPEAPRTRATASKKAVDARLAELQGELASRFALRVHVAGTSGRGRITFHFESEGQLSGLVERLGLDAADVGKA